MNLARSIPISNVIDEKEEREEIWKQKFLIGPFDYLG
jgi:hypothetical protein